MLLCLSQMRLKVLLSAGLIASMPSWAAAQTSAFTTIDISGQGTGVHQGTLATAINAAGDVAGIYIDGSGNQHAFLRTASGTITPFDASGSGGKNVETIPIGIDAAGDVAGIYLEPYTFSNHGSPELGRHVHGFLRIAATGAITLIDVSGEDTGNMEGTYPLCINAAGQIAGSYSTTIATASGTNSFAHGFVRDTDGTIHTFDAAIFPTSYGSTNPGTQVTSINATGEVSGTYLDGAGALHGFLRDASGNITLFEDPNAATGSEQGTIATAIDAAGDIVGAYIDANNAIHGYLRKASTGAFTTIDAADAGTLTYQGTYPDAFDEAGDIFGSFTDANNVVHGFVLPANGTIVTYDAPGSGVTSAQRVGGRLNSKLSQLGKSFGVSSKSKRAHSPMVKLKTLLANMGRMNANGTGLLNGNGPNPSGTGSIGNFLLNSVNASGEVIGLATDGDFVFHGYLRAANGSITTIDAPNAGTAADQGTGGLAINAAGVIAGGYADSNSVLHGFIYDSSTLTATTTVLTPAPTPNPSLYWEPVTLSATVTASGGAPPNGETVTFLSGSTSLGAGTLASGAASLTTTDLPTGTDSITAVYAGDANFAGSTSTAVSQTVDQASSTTTLTSTPNPSTAGQIASGQVISSQGVIQTGIVFPVTLTATVTGQFGGIATGSVAFSYNSGTSLGSSTLSGGSTTVTTNTLPVGTDSVIAVYSGDGNFTGSTSNTLSQVVNPSGPPAPAPVLGGISPAFTNAGGAAFTLTVTGSDFVNGSTVYWGTSALTTTYGSANQLTAQVTAAEIATAGQTSVTVQTPAPGGGTSNAFDFEIDTASTTAPNFAPITATVTAGSPASYTVSLPANVVNATAKCLNLPTGASCSYSSMTSTVTITTTAATPAGTYLITVVFTESVLGPTVGWILLPILLLPLYFLRRKLAARGAWVPACLGLVLLAGLALTTGCGGGSGRGLCTGSCPAQTHQVTSSGTVTMIVQ